MRKIQIFGLIIMLICSTFIKFKMPEKIENKENMISVTLEGEFKKTGIFEFKNESTIKDIVNKIGINKNANINALNYDYIVIDESSIYLPALNDNAISLNNGSKEELMRLNGIGEKTALKIIDYRKDNKFMCIEDIMNINGIGEKTYIKLRDYLCL